jgi:hypothetical protein
MRSAAPVTRDLVLAIVRFDTGAVPIAEVARRVATQAEDAGATRPSYERIRQLVHELRLRRSTGRHAERRRSLGLSVGVQVTTLRRSRDAAVHELTR